MDQALTLLTFIRQVSTSNPGRNTDLPPTRFRDSPLFRQHGVNIGSVGAELLRADGRDEANSRFSKFFEPA